MSKIYRRKFDRHCINWDTCKEFNEMYLKAQKQYFSDKLKLREYVTLNEIYEALCLPPSRESLTMGWCKRKGIPLEESIDMKIIPIEGKNEYWLEFECYRISDHMPRERWCEE